MMRHTAKINNKIIIKWHKIYSKARQINPHSQKTINPLVLQQMLVNFQ